MVELRDEPFVINTAGKIEGPHRALPHDRILADLGRASGGRPVTVAVIPNDNFFSVSNFRYETVRRGLPYRMTRAWSDAPLGVDVVILKSRDQGPS